MLQYRLQNPCRGAVRRAVTTRVAKPEQSTATQVTVKTPGAADYIASPFGAGRVSMDGGRCIGCGWAMLLSSRVQTACALGNADYITSHAFPHLNQTVRALSA